MNQVTAAEALSRLQRGNRRFLDDAVEAAGRDSVRRRMLAEGQEPFAAILSCADSRVAPEIAFDTGLGELFVVRVAGNVASPSVIASMEFAVSTLGIRLLLVMAHDNCGAVAASLGGDSASSHLEHLLGFIRPAVDESGSRDADIVARCSAGLQAKRLTMESAAIREAVARGSVRVGTAFYHPGTGEVELL